MKKRDIILVAVIVVVSAVISFVASGAIFKTSKHAEQVEVVQGITSQFDEPDKRYFNNQAFDPAKPISIGGDSNPQPFNNTKPQ